MDSGLSSGAHELQRWTYTAFFEEHRTPLERLAFLLVRDASDAQDVAQEVFAEVYRRWDTLRHDTLLAYARTCVVNRSRNLLRRRAVARRLAPWLVADDVVPAVLVPDRWLWDLVCALPRRQREVVVLRFWCELREDEIAQVLGVSAGTVKSSSHRALRRLETVLQDQPAGDRAGHADLVAREER
jgi:RNA polymerase sigma-70 factor (sigma-E family)